MTRLVRNSCPSIFLFAGTLVLCGCGRGSPADEESHPAPVKAVAARQATLEAWTELFGTTQPLVGKGAQISAAVDGRVVAVLPDLQGKPLREGELVAAGQVVVQLDDRIAKANRAKLASAKADQEEQQKQATYAAALARLEIDRLEKLHPPGMTEQALPLVSRVELEKARINLKDAEAKERAAAARVEAAQAELKGLDVQLTLYALRAPIAGRLGLVRAMPGQTLTAGTTVAEVVALDDIDVLCYASPHVIARLRPKQPARLTHYAQTALDEASSPKGLVEFIAALGQAETGNFAVKVRFPNHALALGANSVARVQVLTQRKEKTLAIPAAALMDDQQPPAVVVAIPEKNKEGKVEYKAAKFEAVVGVRDRVQQLVELTGLRDSEANKDIPVRPDMLYVVEGGHGLETGDPMAIQKEEKAGD
jgi:multidrug efflux pump subunit AcrA (membrane-fusion protein)